MPSKYKRKTTVRDPYKKIVIAMEGNKTEPKYFEEVKKKFKASTLNIILLNRDNTDNRSAPIHVIKQLNSYKKDNRFLRTDELWLVIDKDRWTEEQLHIVASQCSINRYNLGLSNPCFELWLVLHYENLAVEPGQVRDGLLSVHKIKRRLATIRQREGIGSYSDIIDNINDAVKNADNLDIDKTTRWPNTLGTRVYLLADSIINNS